MMVYICVSVKCTFFFCFLLVSFGRAIAKVKYTITFHPFTTFTNGKVNFSGDHLFFVRIDALPLLVHHVVGWSLVGQ